MLARQVISAGDFVALFARSFCDFAMIKVATDCVHLNTCVNSISHAKCETLTHPGL